MVLDSISTPVLASFLDAVGELDVLPVVSRSLDHRLQETADLVSRWALAPV